MKNVLFLLGAALFATTSVTAQLNLTNGSYPASVIGTDSLRMTTSASTFPSLSASANATWDMSTVTDSSTAFFAYRVPAAFYQFADSNNYTFGAYSYKGNVQSSVTSTGILQYGVNILQANYSLAALTSGPNDSLYISSQADTFHNGPLTKIAFPATYHSSWSSSYTTDFNFELSVLIASLSHAPGIARTYTTEIDSVKGWGKMRVKDASGSPSPYFNVLQVQTITMTVDSFFINGAPASALLLSELSLTQGQKDTTYQQNYYRAEEVTPLAQVTFKDGTFSTPTTATTHVQRIYTNGVQNVVNNAGIKVYPNPVSGQSVTVTLPATGGAWSYELIDINGKKVQDGQFSNSSQGTVSLPSSLTEGIYYLKVNNDGKQVSITPVDVRR